MHGDDLSHSVHGGKHEGSITNLNNAARELARLSEQKSTQPYPLNQVPNLLDQLQYAIETWPQNLETLLDVREWRFDNLILEESGAKRLRKPRVKLSAKITTKGNLAFQWHPGGRRYSKAEDNGFIDVNETDFWRHPLQLDEKGLGQFQARSEIVFIRGIEVIEAIIEAGHVRLAASLHYCTRAIFLSVKSFLDVHFEVEQIDDFELVLNSQNEICGWEIINLKTRSKKQLADWMDEFPATYSVRPTEFIDLWFEDNGRGPFSAGKITDRGSAKRILERLQDASPELGEYIKAKNIEKEERRLARLKREQAAHEIKLRERTRDDWETISKTELEKLVWSDSTTNLASHFGVSDNAINKKCHKFGIAKPPRGFWAKVYAGRIPHPSGKPPDEDSEG